jgi:hypothetical protein
MNDTNYELLKEAYHILLALAQTQMQLIDGGDRYQLNSLEALIYKANALQCKISNEIQHPTNVSKVSCGDNE